MARLQGTEFNGDIAHLVGFSGGGGVAYVDVLCNNWYGFGVSAINNSFSPVPTYSWTVMVIAHEIGIITELDILMIVNGALLVTEISQSTAVVLILVTLELAAQELAMHHHLKTERVELL